MPYSLRPDHTPTVQDWTDVVTLCSHIDQAVLSQVLRRWLTPDISSAEVTTMPIVQAWTYLHQIAGIVFEHVSQAKQLTASVAGKAN